MPHVDDGTLHALLDGALRAEEPERADEVETHLETCADCRARLQQAEELRGIASGIMASLDADADLPVSPDFGDVIARADSSLPGSRIPGSHEGRVQRQYRWTRGLAWAATVVVALGTGYLARDLTGPEPQRPGQELMTRQGAVPSAATDAAESEAIGRRDAAAEPEDAPLGEAAGDGARQQPDLNPERRALAAPAETEAANDADVRQEALRARTPGPGEEAAVGAVTLELADAVAAPPAWVEADVADVENRVGTILVLPGAEIARAELMPGVDTVARTLQVLPDDVEVQVIQTRVAAAELFEGGTADAADAAPTVAAEADGYAPASPAIDPSARLLANRSRSVSKLDSVARDAGGAPVMREVSVETAGVRLTLVGPLPRTVLELLAAGAAPRQR